MNENNEQIRKPAVAGSFYPANASELTKTIASYFSEVEKIPIKGNPSALIVPHAGYPYSGLTAAKAYKLLEGQEYDTVVVISPSHTVFFKGASVYDGDGYETPLGIIEIDKELSQKISEINPVVYLSNMGHSSGNTRGEHALEVQLPFLQVVLGKFKLVAIVMGDQEEDTIRALGETLASTLEGSNALLIASTDLSHFHPEKRARKLDFNIQKAVEQFDPKILIETLETGKGEACGGGIMAAVMIATQRLGASEVQVIDYTTSGAVTGDFDEVVGYLSAAVVGESKIKKVIPQLGIKDARKQKEFVVTDEIELMLKKIAHDAIKTTLEDKKYIYAKDEKLEFEKGLFVTLHLDNELRGCIGRIRTDLPLYEATAEMAQAAAFDDPRFPKLTSEEFDKVDIEISVLSQLERVKNFDKIKIGKHGLLIKLDFNSGLLLPQVASDLNWDTTEFLEQTCLKAGLPKNSYQSKYAEVYTFTADVF